MTPVPPPLISYIDPDEIFRCTVGSSLPKACTTSGRCVACIQVCCNTSVLGLLAHANIHA